MTSGRCISGDFNVGCVKDVLKVKDVYLLCKGRSEGQGLSGGQGRLRTVSRTFSMSRTFTYCVKGVLKVRDFLAVKDVYCVKDVLRQLDGACSGRTSCDVSVRSLVELHPCQKDFVSYLEASYDCVEGD